MKRLSTKFLGKNNFVLIFRKIFFEIFFELARVYFWSYFLINKNHTIFQGCKLQGYPLEIMYPQEVNTGVIKWDPLFGGLKLDANILVMWKGFPCNKCLVWGW